MRPRSNSRATPPRSAPENKIKEVVPKKRTGEAQMRDNPEGSELDPAVVVRRRCKKNIFFVLS